MAVPRRASPPVRSRHQRLLIPFTAFIGLIVLWRPLPLFAADTTGTVRCEIWMNVEGPQITDTLAHSDLNRPADETRQLDSFELNPAPEVPQACAVRGYLHPPQTGDYTFFISADDTALLYLSKDGSPGARKIIATVPSYTGVRDYKHFAAQTSKSVHLMAGKSYYIEALLKNDTGASHVSVGWTLPDQTTEAPIAGKWLSPAQGSIAMPRVQIEPPKLVLKPESPIDQTPGFHKFPAGAHVEFPADAVDFSYLLFFPTDFAATHDTRPLMIFLHGNGHQGVDLEGCLNEGPANMLRDDKSMRDWFPMIALFPQAPPDWRWDSPGAPAMVNALIKAVIGKYPRINRNRVYITGLSMGGKGTWLTALDSPRTFAAITTFSAVAVRPEEAKTRLAPVRNIHIICGGDDGDFCAGSKQMYQTLQPVMGPRVQLTVKDHEGHGVWGDYYPHREIYEEMMKYSK